ncbi:CLUMA_CG018120, isoform A [Clunio marinus]|uniref:CLUMA_CG018120, isoform A n=1 Tax=Clunio marinus TaxID=568069 RepID=A0A1J1IYR6_9DIPT|nr:CLUMA_CG018120, isoform A [Clunio marinus]
MNDPKKEDLKENHIWCQVCGTTSKVVMAPKQILDDIADMKEYIKNLPKGKN